MNPQVSKDPLFTQVPLSPVCTCYYTVWSVPLQVVHILGEAQKSDTCPLNIKEALDHAMVCVCVGGGGGGGGGWGGGGAGEGVM